MSETTNSSAGRSGRALGAGILGLFLLLPFLWRLERASFHMDETGWVLASNRVVTTRPWENISWVQRSDRESKLRR
jgi:hypothetical protein